MLAHHKDKEKVDSFLKKFISLLLGCKGFAYEYGGSTIDRMTMDERMTLCNMSIEGGALIGYANPDQTTINFVNGREYSPKGKALERAIIYWKSIASDLDAKYDDVVSFNANELEPMITWESIRARQ